MSNTVGATVRPVANDVPVTPMLTNPVFACRQPPLGSGEPCSWYCQRAFTAGFQQLPTELLQATCAGSVTVVPARGPACAPSGSITRARAKPRPIVASVRRTDPRSSPGEPRITPIQTRRTPTAQPSIRALGPCVLACRECRHRSGCRDRRSSRSVGGSARSTNGSRAGQRSLRRAAWAGLQDSMPRAALLSIHARVAGTQIRRRGRTRRSSSCGDRGTAPTSSPGMTSRSSRSDGCRTAPQRGDARRNSPTD